MSAAQNEPAKSKPNRIKEDVADGILDLAMDGILDGTAKVLGGAVDVLSGAGQIAADCGSAAVEIASQAAGSVFDGV